MKSNIEYKKTLRKWGFTIAMITIVILVISWISPIKINPDAWLAYIGIIISSIVTFIVLYKTIEQNYKLSEENKINSVIPILKVSNECVGNIYKTIFLNYKNDEKKSCSENSIDINIKNIGNGPAVNIEVKSESYNANEGDGILYKFDLGVNEDTNIKIIYNKNMLKEEKKNYYINFILEYQNIYMNVYEVNIKAIKTKNSPLKIYQKEYIIKKQNLEKKNKSKF